MQSDGKVDVMGKLVAYFKLQLISLTTYFLFFFFVLHELMHALPYILIGD